jgi:hypothetical protein
MRLSTSAILILSALAALSPTSAAAAEAARFGPAEITLGGQAAPASATVCGFAVVAREAGPQVALVGPAAFVACVRQGEEAAVAVPIQGVIGPFTISAEATVLTGQKAAVELVIDVQAPLDARQAVMPGAREAPERGGSGRRLAVARDPPRRGAAPSLACGESVRLSVQADAAPQPLVVHLRTRGDAGESAVRWRGLRLTAGSESIEIPISVAAPPADRGPPPLLPALRPPIEQALIEWDWRMQDGIGTARAPGTWAAAVQRTLDRGEDLLRDLQGDGAAPADGVAPVAKLRQESKDLAAAGAADESRWLDLWRRAHQWRRHVALSNPLARTGPILFVKQVPGAFSHQLTQYYGRYARPGGGAFVLDEPGRSMACRPLAAGALPEGSYQHPEVSFDGRRVLFAFCKADTAPENSIEGHHGRYYHLYEMAADGTDLRQLTDGPFNDFAPRYLPNGQIVFISTRRGGWHRCGAPGCENYTLALCNADGSAARAISCHETQEWDPAVLDDGRIIYTRWDYVDRHAVFYEQLWAVHPDGSVPTAFYGNNTFNPVGLWEARPVPHSTRVIATAGAHHAMTAGSIVLVDVGRGVDGPAPLLRLTPDAPFPESEALLLPNWRSAVPAEPPPSIDAQRWPGHCYRSPYPLAEKYFLAAYSFDSLVGEPKPNAPNMFGLYLVDAFGNKELLYRDLNIASLWPIPLGPRPRPPVVASTLAQGGMPTPPLRGHVPPEAESMPSEQRAGHATPGNGSLSQDSGAPGTHDGTFFVQDVYQADPPLVRGSIKRLRVVQVLPKSTPGINRPPVGLANASPGKQVLGTVPVEPDGSAYFRAPAGVPLALQALDEFGRAVQIMRSITYLQPGENAACIGCHEPRTSAPPARATATALARPPSAIAPAPAGSRPLSYPVLVQPVLDERCVSCHSREKPDGGVILTGEPQGHYTVSYNALAPRVPISAWTGAGNFRAANSEPISLPDHFGSRASPLMKLLLAGHQKVRLSPAEIERLVTWMDANALFYGTFDPADQARQQRGETIEGPKLQ